jgi:hypothetical protein
MESLRLGCPCEPEPRRQRVHGKLGPEPRRPGAHGSGGNGNKYEPVYVNNGHIGVRLPPQ